MSSRKFAEIGFLTLYETVEYFHHAKIVSQFISETIIVVVAVVIFVAVVVVTIDFLVSSQ